MRPSDYAFGAGVAAANPAAFYLIEKVSPSHVGRGGFAPGMRLVIGLGLGAGFLVSYSRSYRAPPSHAKDARGAGR
jgi:NADH-ubiquinone oxidoreductase complex I, 21 kDa subunit